MPLNQQLIDLLVRKNSMLPSEWINLIEIYHGILRPHLDHFTLTELGQTECLTYESFTKAFGRDSLEVAGEFSLKTQGIFGSPYGAGETFEGTGFNPGAASGSIKVPNGYRWIWGLTRKAEWLLAKVWYEGQAGYKSRGSQYATKAETKKASVEEILVTLKIPAKDIWRRLGTEVSSWTQKRKWLYEQAQGIETDFEAIKPILDRIANNSSA